MSIKLTMTAALLAALACLSAASAQTAQKGDMARCTQLYSTRSHYNANGGEATAQDTQAELALEDCRAGRYDTGIASLEGMLRSKGIPVPPAAQTANAPQ